MRKSDLINIIKEEIKGLQLEKQVAGDGCPDECQSDFDGECGEAAPLCDTCRCKDVTNYKCCSGAEKKNPNSTKKLKEQVLPQTCVLPVNTVGPFPNNFNTMVWSDTWIQKGNQQGCNWVKARKIKWGQTLSMLHNKQAPNCNPKWQNMLNFKMKTAMTVFGVSCQLQ